MREEARLQDRQRAPGPQSGPETSLPPPRTVFTDDLGELVSIFDDDVNVCVVRRPRPELGSFEVVEGAERAYLAPGQEPPWTPSGVREDVAFLATLLTDLLGAQHVGARMATLPRPMCPSFHVDHIPMRLVCTYRGPGTEWVDESGQEELFSCGKTSRRGRVRSAQVGDVVLLKGEAWPLNEGRGAAHRSPPHQALRVVVSLDPL